MAEADQLPLLLQRKVVLQVEQRSKQDSVLRTHIERETCPIAASTQQEPEDSSTQYLCDRDCEAPSFLKAP